MERAVFFDVDGVIRHNNTSKDGGCYYCLSYDQVDYINGIVQAHKFLQDAGYKIFWVTMQNCIKEGLISSDGVDEILLSMVEYFNDHGVEVEEYFICQSPDETDESKSIQKAFTINQLVIDNNIDLSRSIGVGDRKHDIDAYDMAGIGTKIQAINMFGDHKFREADYHYTQNPHISNLESLIELFRIIHGCNDIPRILGIAKHFPRVEKVWGEEYHIVNSIHGNYCSKFLSLKHGHISSLHYHQDKCETFTVLAGVVNIENDGHDHICITGDSLLIQPDDKHRFSSINGDAVLLETSTFHKDDDTYRLEESK